MKRKLIMIAIWCHLLVFGVEVVEAQDGAGVQVYASPEIPSAIGVSAFGVGFGMRIFPRVVVSISGYLAHPPVLITFPDGRVESSLDARYEIPLEYGGYVAYRFSDLNPALYVFIGYSRFPQGGMSIPIDLVHAGVGLAPFKGDAEIYPEVSIVAPLHSQLIAPIGGNFAVDYPGRVPVMLRATIRFYIIP